MASPAPSTTIRSDHQEETPPKKGWRKFLETAGNWLKYGDKGEWLKDMRGNLSLVATVISTMTFQVAMNPPGGVVSSRENGLVKCPGVSEIPNKNCDDYACPGESVLAARYPEGYFWFLLFNTISFVASLSVCLLLVSGLPLNHRFPTWFLLIGMCITLTSLALTYLFGALLITPDAVWNKASNICTMVLIFWFVLIVIVGLFLMIRFVVWLVRKCTKKSKMSATPRNNRET